MDYDLGPNSMGTYARVIQNHQSFNGDAYLVLYLLPSSLYLFTGYWPGFELTVAAGRWKEREEQVFLEGVGTHILMDVLPFSRTPRRHEREFSIVIEHYSRALFAETEHQGWSLLSWRGYLHYLGRSHFFDLENDDLPKSIHEVEPWTQRFLDGCGFCQK